MRCVFAPYSFLSLALIFLCAVSAQAFTVGYFQFEPHSMLVNGKPTGAAVEYLRDYIAPEMGVDVEFVGPIPFARLLRGFTDGEYDAVLLMAKNPQRSSRYIYPAEPFGNMESALLLPKGMLHDRIEAPEELAGLVIGYAERAWRAEPMRKPFLHFELVSGTSATALNFLKFDEGRIDAIYSPDKYALEYRAAREKIVRPCKVVPISDTTEGYYTVFKAGADMDLVRAYERALEKVGKRVSYPSLVERYLVPKVNHKQPQ